MPNTRTNKFLEEKYFGIITSQADAIFHAAVWEAPTGEGVAFVKSEHRCCACVLVDEEGVWPASDVWHNLREMEKEKNVGGFLDLMEVVRLTYFGDTESVFEDNLREIFEIMGLDEEGIDGFVEGFNTVSDDIESAYFEMLEG